jgi:predicted phage-related endonuclease
MKLTLVQMRTLYKGSAKNWKLKGIIWSQLNDEQAFKIDKKRLKKEHPAIYNELKNRRKTKHKKTR